MNFLFLVFAVLLLYIGIFIYMRIRLAMNLKRGEACHGKKCGICTAYYPEGRG